MTRNRRRVGTCLGVLAAASAMVAAVSAVPVQAVVAAGAADSVERVFGVDRFATAISVSQSLWADHGADPTAQAGAVVLARSDDFTDALAGVPLAADRGGPLLLTPTATLHPSTEAEIKRILPPGATVYLLGGIGALSQAVADRVTADGFVPVRLGGATRIDTALAIADAQPASSDLVLLTTGLNFPDALAAGAAAGAKHGVVLLTQGSTMPAGVTKWITAHKTSASVVAAVGGPAAAAYPTADRTLVGADRYATATLVANEFFTQPAPPARFALASGVSFPDALSGGAWAATVGVPMLLTLPTTLSSATASYLTAHTATITGGVLLGGPGAVDEPTRLAAEALVLVPVPVAPVSPAASVDLGPTMSPRPDPSVTDFVVACPSGTATATVTAQAGGSVVLDGHPALTASESVTVPLAPGQAVRWTLAWPGRAAVEQQARCLPADFPAWQATRTGTPASQWYVLAPTSGTAAPAIGNPLYVVVADDYGTPVWWQSVTNYRPVDAKLSPGGGLIWAEAGIFYSLASVYHQVGWDGTAQGVVGAGAQLDQHDLVPAQGGGWYAIRYLPRDCVGTGTDCTDMTAFGGSTAATIIDCEIVKLDAAGSVVWTWKTRDHLAFAEWADLVPTSHIEQAHAVINGNDYWDIIHLNSVEDDGDGLIISSRNLDAVYRINKSDGSIDWKLGGTPTPRSLAVPGADRYPLLNSQHDARRLPNGHVTVFDNGTEGLRVPRVLEMAVDPVTLTASVVRTVRDARETSSPCCGSARPVASGGFAIAWGGTGLFTETDAAGSPVLSIDLGAVFSYRVVPVPPGEVSRATLQSGMDAMHPRPTGG
ncbi:MAG TPA: cell wall-binding repeat-containing protein [Actinomycetes bacterium]